jgi:hypothetical protein
MSSTHTHDLSLSVDFVSEPGTLEVDFGIVVFGSAVPWPGAFLTLTSHKFEHLTLFGLPLN